VIWVGDQWGGLRARGVQEVGKEGLIGRAEGEQYGLEINGVG
jgi:hypothetical protein